MSQDAELENFSDGITEELISRLANVEGLKVISRTSAFSYKGKDVDLRTVGKQLKVNHVLEGSVRKSGNKLRVAVQLIKVADDTHLLSETYEREMTDVFAIQDEISGAAVKRIEMALLGPVERRLLHDYVHRIGVDAVVKEDETIEGGLTAMGANVIIEGTVNGGLETFGANITISGRNQDDLRFFGANVILSGQFFDIVRGASATLIISGVFEEDLEVNAAKIVILPTAVIKGDLAYSANLLDRQEGSQILGKLVDLNTDEGEAWLAATRQYEKRPQYMAKALFWFLATLALIVVGLLVHFVMPEFTENVVSEISGAFWKSLGIGLVFLIAVPCAIVIACFTIIGIPLGIISLGFFMFMLYISRVYVGLWIGRKLLGGGLGLSSAALFVWPFVLGIVVMGVLWIIPGLGWVLKAFFLLLGFGAMCQVLWQAARSRLPA